MVHEADVFFANVFHDSIIQKTGEGTVAGRSSRTPIPESCALSSLTVVLRAKQNIPRRVIRSRAELGDNGIVDHAIHVLYMLSSISL
ncbi:unnamed protein product [Heligmosomoides polygyrus]|uniref:Uncharacterized protein n=1 Tax=Heligmosomoides polygyrus TaxID=6339 RepID=A0A183FUP1_HELPZ|nr:unnamed protein product [Heligmosomoides polygyrus]